MQRLLGEMAAAGVLMHANIKFAGDLILQVFGDGPVKLAVAEIAADLAFRVTATVGGAVDEGAGLAGMLNVNGGGRCAITLAPVDRRAGQPYQGVVPLHGDSREPLPAIAPVLEHYMLQSEQLDTRLDPRRRRRASLPVSCCSACRRRARPSTKRGSAETRTSTASPLSPRR